MNESPDFSLTNNQEKTSSRAGSRLERGSRVAKSHCASRSP